MDEFESVNEGMERNELMAGRFGSETICEWGAMDELMDGWS